MKKTLEEISTISDSSRDLLRRIKTVVEEYEPGATIALYGSVARGTQGPESDYDILILTDTLLSAQEERIIDDALFEIELSVGAVLSTMYYSRAEWESRPRMAFRVEVEKDAILL